MIIELLSSRPSKVKLTNIIEIFWKIYGQNGGSRKALEELVGILLYCGGINMDTFNIAEFIDQKFNEQIFSPKTDISNVPISAKHFCETVKSFLVQLLQKNNWELLRNQSFINSLLDIIEIIKLSPLDSLRAVSFLSGMKILRQCYDCYNYFMTLRSAAVTRQMDRLHHHVYSKVFRYSLRDNSAHLRVIPMTELVCWSKENPEILMEDRYSKYILRGLKDSSLKNSQHCLTIFSYIFMKPLVIEKQYQLFKKLIPELTTFLRTNEEVEILVFKIINHALSFLNVTINVCEDLEFSMCIYDRHQKIVEEAGLYFYNTHFKGKCGVDIISETMKFYNECPVKCPATLTLSLMKYFICHTLWIDWKQYLCCCSDDNINDYLGILYQYAFLLNKNASEVSSDIDLSKMSETNECFTTHFSECWVQIMDTDHIVFNPKAQYLMLQLVTLFDISRMFKKTNAEIISKALSIFNVTNSFDVMKKCLLCIQYLVSYNQNMETEQTLISQTLANFIEVLNEENEGKELLNMSYYKVVLVVKNCQQDYENLWFSLVFLLKNCQDIDKIEVIISVLYHLLMKIIKLYSELKYNAENGNQEAITKERSLQENLIHRISVLIVAAFNFIENKLLFENGDLQKRLKIPRMFMKLISLSHSPILSGLFFQLSDNKMESFIICCTKIMQIDCRRNGSVLNPCCEFMRNYVESTIEGHISIKYLKYFVKKLQKTNAHSLIIMNIFKHMIVVDQNPIGALVIVNGLICFYNENKKKNASEERLADSLKEIINFIISYINDLERKYCLKTLLHLYLYLEKLVKEGYAIFSHLPGIVKAKFPEEIRRGIEENAG